MGKVFPGVGAHFGIWVRIVKVDLAVEAQHLDVRNLCETDTVLGG